MNRIILFLLLSAFLSGTTVNAQSIEKTHDEWIQKFYIIKAGNLWFNSIRFAFPDITNTRTGTDTIPMYNAWDLPMELSFKNLPEYTTGQIIPPILNPGEEGKIIMTYDPVRKGTYGSVYENIWLYTNDTVKPQKRLILNPNIMEDFSGLTEQQRAEAPRIVFEKDTYIFDTVATGSKVEYSFIFRNEGKSDLIIRNVKAGCGCTATHPEKTLLKPGESSNIGIVFNTSGRNGSQQKTVDVVANDPARPLTVLTIKGYVRP
ncbi:MAG: DUF1573 domain-containing protein [Bacteroidales bacterium]|nr:DUF1573 domain-containing protein [Lentimicrobiaceae bacterium]MDD5694522.1 DUF1573 domain-containing protein [Bacteroidales bacterium]